MPADLSIILTKEDLRGIKTDHHRALADVKERVFGTDFWGEDDDTDDEAPSTTKPEQPERIERALHRSLADAP